MPDYIDPAWEFWTGDPEIGELLAEAADVSGWGILDRVADDRQLRAKAPGGWRFGHGNPDRFVGRLAPEFTRFERARVGRESPPPLECRRCGATFQPDRFGRSYCSRACVPHPGRAPKPKPPRPPKPRPAPRACREAFAALYQAGVAVAEIARRLGVTPGHCKRLRRQLGVEARPAGRPRRGVPQ